MNFIVIWFAFCSIILCSFHSINCENSVTVETKSGPVKGTVIDFNEHKLNQFLGIPYAEPPVGDNRFRKPKPIQKWNKTVDATHMKNICWQVKNPDTDANRSEDCLFLHIWSENKTDTNLRPVMFYIHGGGFGVGYGNLFNIMSLASFDVVLVSINYRLGAFGFLYGSDPSAPGNVGIYDQILALKWVKNNIEHFGGDPTQITIFGQSAGSWSVCAHILSPLSRNLFKRVIMQSGAYLFKNMKSYDSSDHLNAAMEMSQSIGCPDDNKWLDCLRKVDPQKIIDHDSLEPSLIFGNKLLPFTPEDALKMGKFKKGIEVMAGVAESEATIWAVLSSFGSNKLSNTSVHITKAELKTEIKTLYESSNDSLNEKVYDFYISKIDESNQTLLRKAYIAIYSDTYMKCPTYYFTKMMSQYSASNKVYFYELTHNHKYSECYNQEWKGVCHNDDLAFVFGYAINHKSDYPEIDYKFSVMVNQLWSNFAKNGNPLSHSVANTLGVNVTNWPTFRATDQSPVLPSLTSFTKVMELNPKNFGHLYTNPYHGNCDVLWKEYFGI